MKNVSITPQAEQEPQTDFEGAAAASPLTAQEQQQYETLVKGFREAQRGLNAIWRHEKLTELLARIQAGENHECVWTQYYQMERLLHPVATMKTSADVVMLALQSAIAETRETLDPVEDLKAMESDIRLAVDRLGPKPKTILGILVELAGLEGLTVGLDFGNALLYNELGDRESISGSCEQLTTDPDIQIMARAHQLAIKIEAAEAGK